MSTRTNGKANAEVNNNGKLYKTFSMRLLNSYKKSSMQEVQEMLKTKFTRLHSGLKKRRTVSVQEMFTNSNSKHPIFYVPSPLPQNGASGELIDEFGSKSLPFTDSETNGLMKNEFCNGYRSINCSRKYDGWFEFNKPENDTNFKRFFRESNSNTPVRKFSFNRFESMTCPVEEPEPDYDLDEPSGAEKKVVPPRRWSVAENPNYRRLFR